MNKTKKAKTAKKVEFFAIQGLNLPRRAKKLPRASYPFRDLEVGGVFVAPRAYETSVRSSATHLKKKYGLEFECNLIQGSELIMCTRTA